MSRRENSRITAVIGEMPYRLALAGGWIDQPFISKLNPQPPGSMVVIGIEPEFFWMERAGLATGTRNIALKLWKGKLPEGDRNELVSKLYAAENRGRVEPSGSQDMIGLIYPGINRLDYDFSCGGGIFPCHIESNNDPEIARWVESVIHVLPVSPRPAGYNPIGTRRLGDSRWISRLGRSGRACFEAIIARDLAGLGASLNECMKCWAALLPGTISHPTIGTDLAGILRYYQSRYPGAMYSGCGGGYLYVVSEEPVPGAFKVRVRIA